jgi:hypothetical protein
LERGRPGHRGLVLLCLLGAVLAADRAPAQVLALPGESGSSRFPVSTLDLEYAQAHPDQPALAPLLPVEVRLRKTPNGWAAPTKDESGESISIGGPASETVVLDPSGLARVMRVIVARLNEAGLYGVDVRPSSQDIHLETEEDLRPADRTALRIVISIGHVAQVRTISVGDRIKGDWKIDNELHERIRKNSPLQPAGASDDASTNLLDRRALEDYLYRLNRHAGRRVEAALSPSTEPLGVVLDYRVLEAKPWFVYGQVSNTGTNRSNLWQTRLGYTDRQLTNRDDVLSIEYLNAGFDDVNGVRTRYQAPFFGPERPTWMNPSKGDPGWFDWLPREKIPWWGVDRLRWEADFAWNESRAGRSSTLAGLANDAVKSTQFNYGGRFIYEAYQYRDFFVDLWGGLRLQDVRVDNRTIAGIGHALFVLPGVGLHADRINQVSNFNLDVGYRISVDDVSRDDLDKMGRDGTNDNYQILDFALGYSTFLEPLLNSKAWRDPSTELSSTLAHEIAIGVHGQYAFDYRLVPQASQVIGGLFSVRGYNQAVAVGDTIVVGTVEYRFHIPRSLPVLRKPLDIPFIGDFRAAPQQVYGRPDWDLVFRAFVDAGRAIRNDRDGSAAGVNEYNQTLVGAGVGAELQLRSNIRIRADWATALKSTNGDIRNSANVGDSEFHVLFSILY